MYNSDTEILFPSRVIPSLRGLRGEAWLELVDQVTRQEPASLDRLAFVYLMVRLSGCPTCHVNSYRAMHGCTQCASQAVHHFRGSDGELLGLFDDARLEIQRYLGAETN